MLPLNTTIGDHELCAWQPAPGVCWVQTRSPRHVRRLAKRRDGYLVAVGVAGGYLRTYEFRHSLAWAGRLIRRYTLAQTSAGEPKNRPGGHRRVASRSPVTGPHPSRPAAACPPIAPLAAAASS